MEKNIIDLKGQDLTNTVYVEDFDCSYNNITSLKNFNTKIGGKFISEGNPNPYLEDEYKLRKENITLTDNEIFLIMYEKTKLDFYLPQSVKDIFLF